MAYVIAVVGAGGKTTYIYDKAKEYIKAGKTVAITTTTKMWLPDKIGALPNASHLGITVTIPSSFIALNLGLDTLPDATAITSSLLIR